MCIQRSYGSLSHRCLFLFASTGTSTAWDRWVQAWQQQQQQGVRMVVTGLRLPGGKTPLKQKIQVESKLQG